MTQLQKAAQELVDRIADLGASPLDWPEYTALEKALEAEQAQAVEPAKLDKKDRCIDAFGNSMVSVGDHVESDDAIFFVGGISDGGLCSIDKTKPFSAKSGPMSKCVTQGNYAAKAAALSFVYPAPPATGERAELVHGLRSRHLKIDTRAEMLKAADMLEADAQELTRLRDLARDAANAATQLQKQVLVLKAQQVAVPLSGYEISKWWASENGLEDCNMCIHGDFEKVVRAVEARHGIGTRP